MKVYSYNIMSGQTALILISKQQQIARIVVAWEHCTHECTLKQISRTGEVHDYAGIYLEFYRLKIYSSKSFKPSEISGHMHPSHMVMTVKLIVDKSLPKDWLRSE